MDMFIETADLHDPDIGFRLIEETETFPCNTNKRSEGER